MKYLLDDAGDFFESGVTAESGEDAFLLQCKHAMGDGSAFDFVGVDIGDVAANEGLNVFGNDELFHDDDAAVITKGMVFSDDWVVEGDVIEIQFWQSVLWSFF